jgi:two-component system, chemotaxis family, protein-glutamate methylesterase/glutaminase
VEALSAFARGLPADLQHAVVVVLHIAPYSTSMLDKILARNTGLPVVRPRDGDPILAGHVYVASPDRHLVVRDDRVHLSAGPKENGHRPAIDPALRSAVKVYGAATSGVLLSGTGDDGTAGMIAVARGRGATAVQDPEEALYDRMPRAAMRHVEVDAVLPVAELGAWIAQQLPDGVPVPTSATNPSSSARPADPPLRPDPAAVVPDADGSPTRFTCPDCGGVLSAVEDSGLLRFNCSVGHRYSPDSLMAANQDRVEAALWSAVRTLEDRIVLLSRMAERARSQGLSRSAASLERQGRDLVERSATIREALTGLPGAEAEAS